MSSGVITLLPAASASNAQPPTSMRLRAELATAHRGKLMSRSISHGPHYGSLGLIHPRRGSWQEPAIRRRPLMAPARSSLGTTSAHQIHQLQAALNDIAEQQQSMPLEIFCYLLLVSSTAGTALLTGRFLMSCFPQLERKRKEAPWVVLSASTDPVLAPLRKVFGENKQRLEGMDVASVAALSILIIVVEAAFGPDGLLLGAIPYPVVQDAAQMLLITEKVFSLPMWLLLVFRWINYI